jgi:hypothetical protein
MIKRVTVLVGIAALLSLTACADTSALAPSGEPEAVAVTTEPPEPQATEAAEPEAMTGAELCDEAAPFIDSSLYGGTDFLLGLFDYDYTPRLNAVDKELIARVGRDAQKWADLTEDRKLGDAFGDAADFYGALAQSRDVDLDDTDDAMAVAAAVNNRCQVLASRSDLAPPPSAGSTTT